MCHLSMGTYSGSGPGSIVGIATGYGLDGPGILAMGWTVRGSNPGGGEIFRTCSDQPWGPPRLLYNGYWVFPRVKEQLGCDADPSPPSSAMVMKEQNYTSTPPTGHMACTEPQCLYKGCTLLTFYMFWYVSYDTCVIM
jgi:hypothetical protein